MFGSRSSERLISGIRAYVAIHCPINQNHREGISNELIEREEKHALLNLLIPEGSK
jgi:hypothetical protein